MINLITMPACRGAAFRHAGMILPEDSENSPSREPLPKRLVEMAGCQANKHHGNPLIFQIMKNWSFQIIAVKLF
jgi:hypothetical protein